jgi:methylenetetrahydrofolate dehydrogenase (NADP+) / methenyltetrahydrofolate cyclohydrolase
MDLVRDLHDDRARTAGILIVAAGPLKRDGCRAQQTLRYVIDVAITRAANGNLVGDVDVESAGNVDGAITPVPDARAR